MAVELNPIADNSGLVAALNDNFDKIEARLNVALTNETDAANFLGKSLDANSQRIINLPAPLAPTDAARFVDITSGSSVTAPSPVGNTGKFLTSNGSSIVWGSVGIKATDYYTTDMGAALQAAHNALGPDGGIIEIPPHPFYYAHSTTAVFTKPVLIRGGSHRSTEILVTTSPVVCITSNNWLAVEGIEFTAISAAANTAVFIKQLASSANHSGGYIRSCKFTGGDRQYWTERSNEFRASMCSFGSYYTAGMYMENLTNPDEGDSHISDCTFQGGVQTFSTGCLVKSTSGIYWCNNKVNGINAYGCDINVGTSVTGDFNFIGGSIEGFNKAAIRLVATSGLVVKTQITGVQMSSVGSDYVLDINTGAWETIISGNVLNGATTAINVGNTAKDTTIFGNTIFACTNGIVANSATNGGLTIFGNHIQNDVPNVFTGELVANGQTNVSSKQIDLSRTFANSSAVTYVDLYKWQGVGTADIRFMGTVQGIGATSYFRKIAFNGVTRADLQAAVTVGAAIDVQLATVGSDNVISVRRNSAGGGTSVTGYLEVKLEGYPTAVVRI